MIKQSLPSKTSVNNLSGEIPIPSLQLLHAFRINGIVTEKPARFDLTKKLIANPTRWRNHEKHTPCAFGPSAAHRIGLICFFAKRAFPGQMRLRMQH
jgi:hypothetical protein